MGNQCGTRQQSVQGENLLESFRRLLDVANSKNCTNHHIITTLVKECKTLANSNHFEFIYCRTVPAQNSPDSSVTPPDLSKYNGALMISIQGIPIGSLHFDERKLSDFRRKSMIGLVMYAMQIMERNYLRQQAASVISVVGAQKRCKSIPAILAAISRFIQDSLRCESVSLFRVDPSARKIVQLHPNRTTILSFDGGILGHVVKTKEQFIVYNNEGEKQDSGVGSLRFETVGSDDVESALCVPIMNSAVDEIVGLILAVNKGDGAPFCHLDVDLLQILSVEIGDILESFATKIKLTLDDEVHEDNTSASSLLHYYRKLEAASSKERYAVKVVTKKGSVADLFKRKMLGSSNTATVDCDEQKQKDSGDAELSSIVVKNGDGASDHEIYAFLRKAMKSVSSELSLVSNTTVSTALGQIQEIAFDPFEHTPSDLGAIALAMFVDLDLIETLEVEPVPFSLFIKEIMGLYHDSNPYHNVYHGFSVLSFSYSFIKKTDLRSKFPALDLFAMLISALCHDVDHPGNTNAFEIATNSELARQHNDKSVLENHHCYVTFRTMQKAECNFLADFSNGDRKRLRKIVIQSIMATDMAQHFALCSTLDQIEKDQLRLNMVKQEKTDKFTQMICNVFVHAADITAPAQPLIIALKWGDRIALEFTNQVHKEEELGLESLAMMQGLDDRESFMKSQRGFYRFVLQPMFKTMARLWPDLNFVYQQLVKNGQYISDEADRLERESLQSSLIEFSRVKPLSADPAKRRLLRKPTLSI